MNSEEPAPIPPPRTKRKKPIGPSTPTPVTPTPSTTASAADNSPDNVYQNSATVVAPPRKKPNYVNISSSSIGVASSTGSGGDGGGMDDTSEKKKPVPRMRNSLRNRGGPGITTEDVATSQSPPLIEQDERLPGSLGVMGAGGSIGSGREDSISPDLRNNTPSPRPKPRGKRGLDSDSATSSGAPPIPPAKPYSTSSPSKRGGAPPGPPPKIPKTIVSDSSLVMGKKKPVPALPPREPTPEKRLSGGGGGGGVRRSSPGNQDRTEVLDVNSGKSLPLEFVERELESVGEADTSKSSSILDTIMSLVGDDVLEDIDSAEKSHAHTTSTPIKVLPTGGLNRSLDDSDEAPPIPAHTMASMELVEQNEKVSATSSGGGGGKGGSKSPMIQEPLSSTYDIVGAVTESVYEQPEAPKLSLPNLPQKSSSYHGPHTGRDSIPPPLPPANKSAAPPLDSTSTATAIVTMARNTNDANVNGGTGHTSKPKKGLLNFGFGKHKDKKKDKVSAEDIGGPLAIGGGGTGIVKSPSINTMSSSTSSSHSPMHDRANSKYSFPGDLGYGVRIKKPVGPRREPPHWANSLSLPIANKA